MNCTLLDRLDRSTANDECMIVVGGQEYLHMVVCLFGLLQLVNDLLRRVVQQFDTNNNNT